MEKQITYQVLLRVSFKMYGFYLIIRSLIGFVFSLSDVLSGNGFNNLFLLTTGDELITGLFTLIVGLCLLLLTNKLIKKIAYSEREISFNAEEIKFIVYCIIQFVLIVFIITFSIELIVEIVLFIYLIKETLNINDFTRFLFPLLFLAFTIIARVNAMKIVRFIIK